MYNTMMISKQILGWLWLNVPAKVEGSWDVQYYDDKQTDFWLVMAQRPSQQLFSHAGMEPTLPSCLPGPEVIKLFSCSTQLRLKFILLIVNIYEQDKLLVFVF